MDAPVASVDVDIDAIGRNGETFVVSLRIGVPYRKDEDVWSCPVSLTPLYSGLRDQSGADAFQALCLASRLAVTLLTHFRDDGGQLVNRDGTPFALDAYLGTTDRSKDA